MSTSISEVYFAFINTVNELQDIYLYSLHTNFRTFYSSYIIDATLTLSL